MSAALVGTKLVQSELAGTYKLLTLTATVSSADDAITISAASHGITYVKAIIGAVITSGSAAGFQTIQVTLTDSATITIVSKNAAGSTATTFGTVAITVLGY